MYHHCLPQDMAKHFFDDHKKQEWFRNRYLPSKQVECVIEPRCKHAKDEVAKFGVRQAAHAHQHGESRFSRSVCHVLGGIDSG